MARTEQESSIAPPLRALLVGIDHYPAKSGKAAGYASLEGAVHDVERMGDYLERVLEIPQDRVVRLTNSLATVDAELEAFHSNRAPTYAQLVCCFRDLYEASEPGEHVLIHFSGHGSRVPTIFPEVKGKKGFDECLVPEDISDPEVPYLRDLEIDAYLARMEEKEVFVTLVLDCCHSAGATRSHRRVRGGTALTKIGSSRHTGLATKREILALAHSREEQLRSAKLAQTRIQAPKGHVLLAACQIDELAIEDLLDGSRSNGLLTHFLLEALVEMGEEATYRQLHRRIATKIGARYLAQRPRAEGELDRPILGRRSLPSCWGVDVAEILGWPSERIRLAAGEIHGVRPGATFDVYALGSTPQMDRSHRLTTVKVEKTNGLSSWASILEQHQPKRSPCLGDQALLTDPGPDGARCRVAASEEIRGMEEFVSLNHGGERLLRWSADGEPPHFVLSVEEGGYTVCDRAGVSIEGLGERLEIQDPDGPEEVLRRLRHLSRFWGLRSLENPDPRSELSTNLHLTLEHLESSSTSREGWKEPWEIPCGSLVRLIVSNGLGRSVGFVVMNLQPDWGISQVFPGSGSDGYEQLAAGERREIDLRVYLPEGWARGTDVLKVLAATEPFRAGPLCQSSLGVSQESSVRRCSPSGVHPENLDSLPTALRRLAADPERSSRPFRPSAASKNERSLLRPNRSSFGESQDWGCAQVEFSVSAAGPENKAL
ncbi:MAG: caspase family protein [Deltaproteobacteria bacterium]|nr:caspase family protein [Deltaproteobacteria bacterium]